MEPLVEALVESLLRSLVETLVDTVVETVVETLVETLVETWVDLWWILGGKFLHFYRVFTVKKAQKFVAERFFLQISEQFWRGPSLGEFLAY